MNKRSFFVGFLLGVLAWSALSFYLYHSLTDNASPKLPSLQKNVFNSYDSDEGNSNSIGAGQLVDGKSSYFKEKLRKEKKKHKISQKLLEELKPVPEKQFEEFGLIKNVEDQLLRDEGYKTHAFNVLISNHLGVIRDIPDTRHKV